MLFNNNRTDDSYRSIKNSSELKEWINKKIHGINSHHNIISDIFEGYIAQTITCDNCKTTTYSVSPFLELTVQIPIKEDGNIISGAWHSVNRMLGTATPIPLIDCLYTIYLILLFIYL